jgi:hypothetical protein
VCFFKSGKFVSLFWFTGLLFYIGFNSIPFHTFVRQTNKSKGNAAAYAALGFARHLSGDIDSAIDSYHEALSRKPDDPFSSEMLNRALAEAVTYPKSSVFASSYFDIEHQTSAIGSSILANIAKATYSQGVIPGQSVMTSNDMDIAIG